MEFTTLFGGSAIGDGADERILTAAAKSGVNLLVTLGGHGAAIAQRGQPLQRVSAPKVTVVDTTGAGDSFLGAFSFGLASGLTPVRAAELAVACASESVQKPGTQSSYLSKEEAAKLAAPYLAGGAH
jgi:ribokinase